MQTLEQQVNDIFKGKTPHDYIKRYNLALIKRMSPYMRFRLHPERPRLHILSYYKDIYDNDNNLLESHENRIGTYSLDVLAGYIYIYFLAFTLVPSQGDRHEQAKDFVRQEIFTHFEDCALTTNNKFTWWFEDLKGMSKAWQVDHINFARRLSYDWCRQNDFII